jgi:hypothetical protein
MKATVRTAAGGRSHLGESMSTPFGPIACCPRSQPILCKRSAVLAQAQLSS